jgi:polar amino acid transport system substrate-binding protein
MVRPARSLQAVSLGVLALAALFALTACSRLAATSTSSTHTILDDVQSSKVLKVGTYADDKPWSYYDASNKLVGFDIDVVNMLAADLGAKAQFTPVPSAAARISGLKAGTYQLVAANFSLTATRALSISFTTPYIADEEDLVVSTKDSGIKTYHDLTSANKCGIITGSTQEIMTKLAPQIQVIRFQDLSSETAALLSGQIDCVDGDIFYYKDLVSGHSGVLRFAGPVDFGPISLGVPRDDLIWLNWLNQALLYHGMNNDLKIIWSKWFPGTPMPPVTPNY